MTRKKTASFLATAALIASATLASAPAAHAQFDPLVAGISNRPAILLETDYYVYGPGTNFTTPEVNVTIDGRNYNQATTLYLYWHNRENNQRLYYNLAEGFTNAERDLFGRGGTPVRVFVPSLTDFQLFGPDGAFGALPNSIPSGVGLYQFVLEVRDDEGDAVIARGNAMYNRVSGVNPLSGNVSSNTNLSNDQVHILTTPVYVQNGATLTIEPGTVILGSKAGQGTLIVRPGAKIMADGDAFRPIIFSSQQPVGERAPGDWGGLVVSGNAPVNTGPTEGEGDSGLFGGNDPNDNSGVLSYVRVEFAGIRFSEQNELNGIALQGVGAATQIDHLQVHFNQDDGIEFFGGTAQAKYVLVTDSEDDSLDWVLGWTGKLQFFVALQRHGEADNGIEADNFETSPNLEPRSNPTIYNATWVGNRGLQGAGGSDGALLRHGTAVTLRNFIFTNFTDIGINVNGADSQSLVGNLLTVTNGIVFDTPTLSNVQDYLTANQVSFADPRLPNPVSLVQPDVAPLPGSPARNQGGLVAQPPNDGFFTSVSFLGGVNPSDPWIYEGWTTFSDN